MTNSHPYIRAEDTNEIRKFCMHHFPAYGRMLPSTLWHYTTAEGLIGILSTGKLFATQVACLNDNLEQRYFGDLVHAAVKSRRLTTHCEELTVLLKVADEALSKREFSGVGHFVICFSEAEDDLSQWRGYGGGECGYAIGFASEQILQVVQSKRAALLPMLYEEATQAAIVKDVMRMAEIWFTQGISRGNGDLQRWATELITAVATEMDMFASATKHPKFAGEKERRVLVPFDGNLDDMVFRQKRTLLARHNPTDLCISLEDNSRRLPITSVYVGPGPAQAVTKVSVGDLLVKNGYRGIPVEVSQVPYRIP